MAGSVFGNVFSISTWGESHGKGLGVVVDGCPAGLELCEEDIQEYLDRRKPGTNKFSTPRKESDKVEIWSGVFEGKTTGTPISMIIHNESHRSADYSEISTYYRPGHADYTFDEKYGFRDYRGGGRSSGRETAARVAGGAVAARALERLGITFDTYVLSVGDIAVKKEDIILGDINNNPLFMPNSAVAKDAMEYISSLREKGDSVGSVIECIIRNVPVGIGDPVFNKLDAKLAGAFMSIGACKGVEIGDGFKVGNSTGSYNNDEFMIEEDKINKKTNHAGGILGGISDGSDIVIRAAIKPTPSISMTQGTVNKKNENIDINIKGRHDPIIGPRAVVVCECMAALVVMDSMLLNMSSRMENIEKMYGRGIDA